MSLVEVVEFVVLGLAAAATWLSMRPAPSLDWERLLKVSLATLMRGEVEAQGGDSDQWWAALCGVIPYHPAGRRPDQILSQPSLDEIGVPALEGERALVEQLEALDTVGARWAVLYEGEGTKEALMSDPTLLGPAYDPAKVLSPGVGWDEVAAWTDEVQIALARRLSEVVVLVVGGEWAQDLRSAAPHTRVETVASNDAEVLADVLLSSLPGASDRCAVVAGGADVIRVLQAMHRTPALRDRVLCVLSLGGALDGEWVAENFTQTAMDTEINRATAYMDLVDVDPSAPLARSWATQRFPRPQSPPSGWAPIERIGLGPLPLERVSSHLLARALWVLLAFRVGGR